MEKKIQREGKKENKHKREKREHSVKLKRFPRRLDSENLKAEKYYKGDSEVYRVRGVTAGGCKKIPKRVVAIEGQ